MRMQAEPPPGGGPMVQGFAPGAFRVDGAVFRAVLMTVASAVEWTPPVLAELSADDLRVLVEARPEFILLGTGAMLVRPPIALRRALEAANIGLEPMDSRAAATSPPRNGPGRTKAAVTTRWSMEPSDAK